MNVPGAYSRGKSLSGRVREERLNRDREGVDEREEKERRTLTSVHLSQVGNNASAPASHAAHPFGPEAARARHLLDECKPPPKLKELVKDMGKRARERVRDENACAGRKKEG